MLYIAPIKQTIMKAKDFNYYKGIQYKGYTVTKKGKLYIASAYANPEFSNTNLAKLKKDINLYLSDDDSIENEVDPNNLVGY